MAGILGFHCKNKVDILFYLVDVGSSLRNMSLVQADSYFQCTKSSYNKSLNIFD